MKLVRKKEFKEMIDLRCCSFERSLVTLCLEKILTPLLHCIIGSLINHHDVTHY